MFDVTRPELRHFLAASSFPKAEQLFLILTELLTDHIEMRPLFLNSPSIRKPWYFWLVDGGQPSLTALQTADRAWWGLSTPHAEFSLGFGWPWELCVTDRARKRLPRPWKGR